jgi:hypothetical protein
LLVARLGRLARVGAAIVWQAPFVRVNPDNKLHEYGHALQSRTASVAYLGAIVIAAERLAAGARGV